MQDTRRHDMAQSLNILVIEDSPVDRKLLDSMLNESGKFSQINIVSSFQEALAHINKSVYDVILLDLDLPDSRGEQTLVELNQQYPLLPIVVNTGAYEDDLGLRTLGMGAQDFLIKGKYNAYTLNKALHYAIERKNMEMQLKLAYQQLKETQTQLIQSEKLKIVGGLASGVAHEVKNPLATILYGVTYLADNVKAADKNYDKVLSSIKEATKRANSIITDLLDFSSITKLEKKSVKIVEVLDKAFALAQHALDKKYVEVYQHIAENLPLIEIDQNRIEQVLVNLILNAAHAMEESGQLTIRINVEVIKETLPFYKSLNEEFFPKATKALVLMIEDTGCGLPEGKLNTIFDPFFTTRRSAGGVGLGLSVCKNIMDLHQADIILENKESKGTRAILVFKI
ncbi:MAG: response regulator [Candidatus Omnitrophica bacterium]|nr:response regulator [Candidatus Omnitrophota bacterium]